MNQTTKKVVFLAPPNEFLVNTRSVPRIGLLYLGAVLHRAGHDVEIRHLRSLDELRTVPAEVTFIGVSATTREYPDAIQILNYFKRLDHPAAVAIGGAHANALPEECARNGFDLVVVGDAEEEIERLVSSKRPPTARIVRCSPLTQLDRIPFPARDLLQASSEWRPYLPGEHRLARTGSILLSRGCPFQCAFCGPHTRYRRRSAENIAAELAELWHLGYRNLVIIDELPFLSDKHVAEFCDAIRPLDMRFRCNYRADVLTVTSARLLAGAGCTRIQFGIESPDQEIVARVKHKGNIDKNASALRICRDYGISSKAMFIWGLPGDSAATADAIVAWVAKHRPDSVQLSSFMPLPGSPLWQQGYHRYVTDYSALSFFEGPATRCAVPTASLSTTELAALRRSILARLSHITHIDRGLAEDTDGRELPSTGGL